MGIDRVINDRMEIDLRWELALDRKCAGMNLPRGNLPVWDELGGKLPGGKKPDGN